MAADGKTGGVDPARLVRRLSQLNASFRRKVQQNERSQAHWQECKYSQILYGQVTEDTRDARISYENVVSSFEDLAVSEAVWESEYLRQRDEIENKFLIFIDNVGSIAVEYETACVAER